MKNRRRFTIMAVAAALLLVLTGVGVWRMVSINGTGPYKAVYQALNEYQEKRRIMVEESTTEMAGAENGMDLGMKTGGAVEERRYAYSSAEAAADADFGETNLQVIGVDEADIVKNDGENLYILSRDPYSIGVSTVSIVRSSDMVLLGQLEIGGDDIRNVQDMYVSGNRLVLLGMSGISSGKNEYWNEINTKTMIYEITEEGGFVELRSFEQEGTYVSSRIIDNNLYLVSGKQIYIGRQIDESEVEGIVPHTIDSHNGNLYTPVRAECILIAEEPESLFTVVSALSITEDTPADTKTMLSAYGSTVYCSLDNLYLVSSGYAGSTELLKFKLSGTTVEFQAKAEVDGWVKDQFALDEGNGFLRVAVTDQKTGFNYLYIYDENMQQVGKTEGLAQGETIRSVRYIGDMAYVVTFRQTDPLFAIDVSDPANPKVLGELKIPGFSTYMHPMDEHTLIGIGHAANETGGITGLKISLFDVSDPMNPTELSKLELLGRCYSNATDDHKAVTWIAEDGLLLMPITVNDETAVEDQILPANERAYGLAISISKENGIHLKGIVQDDSEPQIAEKYLVDWARSIQRTTYVGDTIYAISQQSVIAVDRETLSLKAQLDFLYESTMDIPMRSTEASPGDIEPYTPSSGEIEPFPYTASPAEIEPYTDYTE